MRRNKEEKEFNQALLHQLFKPNRISQQEAIVSEQMLKKGGYKGSMPYTTPTFYKTIAIKQLPKKRGSFWREYSIFVLFRD